MADDDLETGRPRESSRIPIGRSPLGFSQALTLFLSLMLVSSLLCFVLPGNESLRMQAMDRPVDTAQRVLERNLWIDEAVREMPEWSHGAARALLASSASPLEEAIDAFENAVANAGYPRRDATGDVTPVDPAVLDGLHARRAVLLGEVGRPDEALGDLARLEARGHASFVAAVRTAYATLRPKEPPAFASFDRTLAGEDWIGVQLARRLAERLGDDTEAARWDQRAAERRAQFVERVSAITYSIGALIAVGFVIVLVWLARNRPEVARASAEIPPPWTFEAGYAVCVRAAFGGILLSFVLNQVATWTDRPEIRAVGLSLAAVPLLWFVRRRLVVPFGSTFAATFGARGARSAWSWIAITIAAFALLHVGEHALADVAHAFGVPSHWSEGVFLGQIWNTPTIAAIDLVDICVAGSIAVEIGFRGVFYATMRRHYPPWRAALFTALLFSAAQMSSIPAFLALVWASFVLALTYETCRSLVPGIVCGVLSATAGGVATWLLYR